MKITFIDTHSCMKYLIEKHEVELADDIVLAIESGAHKTYEDLLDWWLHHRECYTSPSEQYEEYSDFFDTETEVEKH